MENTQHYVSQSFGLWMLLAFGAVMLAVTLVFARWKDSDTTDGFLVAGRDVGWFLGGCSIAASWIWAPALFISTQISYQKGLAGLFWFTVPNVFALAIFALLAPKIRAQMPRGFSLPQFVEKKLDSSRVHRLYLFPYFFYQLMAVTVQLFAGGNFVSLLTGIPLGTVMPIMAIIAVGYTLVSGLEASIVTDFVQMALILVVSAIVTPLLLQVSGGLSSLQGGLSGVEKIPSVFDSGVAFSFGIVTSIGLIAGAISDQQYWQRSFAIKESELRKAFLFGAILFAIVPLALSVPGFIAANAAQNIALPEGVDVSLIGVQAVSQLLPPWAVLLFVLALLCGLCSTLDSGLSASSSLWVTDVAGRSEGNIGRRTAQKAIIGTALCGLLIALAVLYIPGFGLQHLWWVMNTIAACVLGPTLLCLYHRQLSEPGVFWGVLLAFVLGIPAFIYGNIHGNSHWIVYSSLFVIVMSTGLSMLLQPDR